MGEPDERMEWRAEIPVPPLAILRDPIGLTSFGIEAGLCASTAFARSSLAWQRKLIEFASMRLDKNTEATRKLADAQDMSEVLRIQSEYFRTAVADYVQGTQELMGYGADVSREILTPLKDQADKIGKEAERLSSKGGKVRAEVAA
jgi:Phasin protein